MKNNKFLKHYFSAFLSGLMVLTTVANPMTTIVANATVSPATSVVTDGGSKQAVFKHGHKTAGEYETDVKIGSKTVSGYTSPSACYHTKNEHKHTASCENWQVRYVEKAIKDDNGNYLYGTGWQYFGGYDQAYYLYTNAWGNNPNVDKTFRQILQNDADFPYKTIMAQTAANNWTRDDLASKTDGPAFRNMLDTMYGVKGGSKSTDAGFDDILDMKISDFVKYRYENYYGDEDQWGTKKYDGNWYYKDTVTYKGTTYTIATHKQESGSPEIMLYYDQKLKKFVGNTFDGALTRDQETIFSVPDLIFKPYYWAQPSSEKYFVGYNCNSATGPIYSNNCGTNEGKAIADAWASASGNKFSYSVKNVKGDSSNLKVTYSVKILDTKGNEITNKTINETTLPYNGDSTTAKTGSVTCTESGTYTIQITVKSYVNDSSSYASTVIDNDTATFTYEYTKPCSVTYHLGTGNMKDGATVPAKETNIAAGTTHTPKTATSYTGYYFDGWYKNENCTGTKYTGGALNSDLDLYGKYVQWTVNFYEGSPVGTQKIATRTMIKGDELQQLDFDISNPKGYTPKGFYTAESGQGTRVYTGRGVYTNPSGGFLVDGTYTVNLYADYSANKYNVTYDYNLEGTPLQTDEMTYDQPAVLSTPHVPDDGYFFLGWFEKLTDEVPWFNTDRIYKNGNWDQTQDVRVYAKYVPKDFKLYYSLNKEEDVTAHMQETHYNEAYGLTAADKQARATYKGYTFLGWYDTEDNTQIFDANGNNTDTGVWKYMRDIYAKATYEPNKYKINYYVENPEEESVNWLQDETTFDQPTTLSNQIKTYDGWTFEGWYEEDDTKLFNTDGTYVGTDTKWDLDRDVTVYAKFTPIKYKLNYNLNKEEAVTAHSKTIQFNSNYGLSNTDKQNRKEYKGYTFLGWYDDDGNLFFDKNGNNVNGSVWRYTHDVNVSVKYEANKYKIYYNTKLEDPANKNIDVVFDDPYSLPAADVSAVPHVKGYTFDGWYMEDGTKIFNTDGSSIEDVYSYDHDIYVYVKYHPNKYTVHYNNTEVEDTVLDKLQEVVFDEEYDSIEPSPYKPGYVFDGHTLEDSDELVWANTGNVTNPIWIFATGRDGDHVNAYKNYSPKEFTVYIGPDFDNDDVLDEIEQTAKIKYDGTYGTLVFEVPDKINGYTFEGFKLIENNVWIADKDAKLASETWIYDDNKDWNTEEATKEFHIAKKWHANEYILRYNDWTVEDDELTSRTVVFDEPYDSINKQPVKTGYVGNGWTLTDINNEKQPVFKYTGEPTKDTFTFELGEENSVIDCFKDYSPKEFTVYLGPDFDDDGVLDTIEQTAKIKYDGTYGTLVFEVPDEITGYTFDGFKLLENDVWVADENATLASETWIYDDGKDWNEENADKEFHIAKKWHRNKYELRYNDWTVEDDELTSRTVIFGEAYDPINKQPYKTGYVGDGWTLTDRNNIKQPVFNYTGEPTKDTFTFDLSASTEVVDCFKAYSPKEFTVYIGPDFDNDDVLDSIEQTAVVRYDETYGTLTFEVPDKINGYTFDGFKLIENDIWVADEKATLASDTWIWDDEKDWNEENAGKEFHIAKKWHANKYTLRYNDWTVEDTELKSRTVVFDEPYDGVNKQPHKKGYSGEGWYFLDKNGEEQSVFLEPGDPTKATFTFNLGPENTVIDCYKKYTPNHYTIYYNTNEQEEPTRTVEVIYDDPYQLPEADVAIVPDKTGYTFDGWVEQGTTTLKFKTDGKPSGSPTYDIEDDLTVVVKYHPNTIKVNYNNTEVEDDNLDKHQTVVYDSPYNPIDISPYKIGYIFDGHYIGEIVNKIWDNKGKQVSPKYIYSAFADNAEVDAYKSYIPKIFDVQIGDDYDENDILDAVDFEDIAVYDNEYFDFPVPEKRRGLELDGYYLLGTDICLAKYDPSDDTLTKTSNIWIWDDGIDWNITDDYTGIFEVERRWTHLDVPVLVRTETDEKVTPGVGNKSDYVWTEKDRTETYDRAYDDETLPAKRGYDFMGYIVDPRDEELEKLDIWNAAAKSSEETFTWLPVGDNEKVIAVSVFKPMDIPVFVPADKYDPQTDIVTPNPIDVTYTYDDPYDPIPTIPEKEGFDYDGIVDKDGNPVWDKDGNPTQEVWQYLEEDVKDFIIKWTPKTYILVYPNKTDEQTITFGEAVPVLYTLTKKGHTFKGYSFDYFGTEIHGFNEKGEYGAPTWLYDMGPSGTKIPLTDLWDLNDYIIHVEPNAEGFNNYDVTVSFEKAYTKQTMPTKYGYFTKGYIEKLPEGSEKNYIWNADGTPSKENYPYDYDITAVSDWQAKTFYVHCGDQVIKVVFDEKVTEKANIPSKSDHTFNGWTYDGKTLFKDDGVCVKDIWDLDVGPDGTHIYCDPQFTHNPVKDDTITPPASNNNPAPPTNDGGKKIQTDDMNNPVIYLVLITLFASAAAVVIATKKKKEEE